MPWATIHGVDDKEVSDKGFETLTKNIEQGFKDEAYLNKVKEDYHEYHDKFKSSSDKCFAEYETGRR